MAEKEKKDKKENLKTKVKDNTKIRLRDLIVVIIRHKILKWLMCLKTGEKMENLTRELEPIEIIQILEKYIVTEIKNVTKITIAIRHHKTKDQWTRRWYSKKFPDWSSKNIKNEKKKKRL